MRSTLILLRQNTTTKMLLLSEQNVKDCLTMKECLHVNRKALMAVATGDAQVPTRLGLQYLAPPAPPQSAPSSGSGAPAVAAADWTLFKPAAFTAPVNSSATDSEQEDKQQQQQQQQQQQEQQQQQQEKESSRYTANMGMKLVSVRANNPSQGLPLVPATILSVHPETGLIQAVVAATYLTAARTAAGSALSTVLLLGKNSRISRVTVFGAGLQAKLHIHALATAMEQPIPHVTILNRTLESAHRLQSELLSSSSSTKWVNHVEVHALSDTDAVNHSLAQSNVVITATNTTTPLFTNSAILRPGTHICGVGSYTPDMQEVSTDMVNRCCVLIDTPEARSVGDLKHLNNPNHNNNNNNNKPEHPVTLLGNALWIKDKNKDSGTLDPLAFKKACFPDHKDLSSFDCTFFKSVGTAIQDVLTADLVVQIAKERQIGTEVEMF